MTAATTAAPAIPEETLKVPAAAPGYEVALGSADGCGRMVTLLFPEVSPPPLLSRQRNRITKGGGKHAKGNLTLIQGEDFQS